MKLPGQGPRVLWGLYRAGYDVWWPAWALGYDGQVADVVICRMDGAWERKTVVAGPNIGEWWPSYWQRPVRKAEREGGEHGKRIRQAPDRVRPEMGLGDGDHGVAGGVR